MDAVERRRAEERLSFLEALVAANERRAEVLATVETSEDTQEAAARVAEVLGLDPARALAVLDLQLRRWTRTERERTRQELDDLRSLLTERA